MKIHEKYILRCIQIAKNGLGTTFPNPMVGCVIVHNNLIIGEGFTSPYGGNHAEVNAIDSVEDKTLLAKATLYVTLEPCSHFGKTPPCADYIIKHNIPKVIIGLKDPHKKVAGKGIQKLKEAGCEVTTGILETECREHHKRFLCFQEKKRPYIILKWAQTKDGFIAPTVTMRNENPQPFWITHKKSRQLVHQWRAEEQAILVGTKTVLADNPKLDVRHWHGKSPIRIVLDRLLKIGDNFNVMDSSVKTIVLTEIDNRKNNSTNLYFEQIDFNTDLALQICEVLYQHNIISVIVEGGSQTLQTFVDANMWDEARVFKGDVSFSSGISAPNFYHKSISKVKIDSDELNIYCND